MAKQFVIGLVLVFFMAVEPCATIANANLIINGSFEEGDWTGGNASYKTIWTGDTSLTGWTVSGTGVDWHNTAEFYPILDASGISNSSAHALDLNLNGITGSVLSQSFTTEVDQWYSLKFYMAAPGYFDGAHRQVLIDIAGVQKIFSTPEAYERNLGWQEFSLDFKGTGNNATLSFSSLNGGYWGAVLDNVSVDKVVAAPEPDERILLLLGCVGITLCFRLQKISA
jgi:choice-of-anchor C domain-containing protein